MSETSSEHLWLRDVRRTPSGEVRLYDGKRLISGTFAAQATASIDEMVRQAWLDGFRAHRDGDVRCAHGYEKGDHHWESGDCLAIPFDVTRDRQGIAADRVAALVGEWIAAEDAADEYGPAAAYTGRDCAEMLRDALTPPPPTEAVVAVRDERGVR